LKSLCIDFGTFCVVNFFIVFNNDNFDILMTKIDLNL